MAYATATWKDWKRISSWNASKGVKHKGGGIVAGERDGGHIYARRACTVCTYSRYLYYSHLSHTLLLFPRFQHLGEMQWSPPRNSGSLQYLGIRALSLLESGLRGGGTGGAEPGRRPLNSWRSSIAGKGSPHSATGLNDSESTLSSSFLPRNARSYILPLILSCMNVYIRSHPLASFGTSINDTALEKNRIEQIATPAALKCLGKVP
jgi:hypothetical protein